MGPREEAVRAAVAQKLRALRAGRGWSLDLLARRSGVSKGMLVQVEQGTSNPSLATLVRLADAFGISITELVESGAVEGVRRVGGDEAVVLWSDGAGSRAEFLLGYDRGEHVELWRWELAPGASYRSHAHLSGTREIVHLTAGRLVLVVAGERHELRPGDSVLYPGDRDHALHNPGGDPARLAMVVIAPPGPAAGT